MAVNRKRWLLFVKKLRFCTAHLKVIEPEQVKILLNRSKNIDFLLQDRYDNKSYRIHVQTEAVYQTMNGSLAWMAVKELQKQDAELQQTEDGVFWRVWRICTGWEDWKNCFRGSMWMAHTM